MEAMKQLVYAFYNPSFRFSKFLRCFPEHRHDIIRILRGNVFGRDFSALFAAIEASAAMPDEPPAGDLAGPTAEAPAQAS